MAVGKISRGGRAGSTRLTQERAAGMPSFLILQDSAGNDHYLWFDTTGDLRRGDPDVVELAAFAPNSEGTVLGTQS
jgi:hypothetical protein